MVEGLEQKRLLPKQPRRRPPGYRNRLSAAKAAALRQGRMNFRIWATLCISADIVKRSEGCSLSMVPD